MMSKALRDRIVADYALEPDAETLYAFVRRYPRMAGSAPDTIRLMLTIEGPQTVVVH